MHRPAFMALASLSLVVFFHRGVTCDDAVPEIDGWRRFSLRDEIAPNFLVVRRAESEPYPYYLTLAGNGREAVDGRWLKTVPVTAGKYYQFSAQFQEKNVETPTRSVLARVAWLDLNGTPVTTPPSPPLEGEAMAVEFPVANQARTEDGWRTLSGTYQAPKDAVIAQLELHFRWSARGEVWWRGAALKETAPPSPRVVRLAAVNHRPRRSKSPQDNLQQFAKMVDESGRQKADIVCLPEGITVVGTNQGYVDVAEPVPGPSTKFLGECAKKNRVYVVAGIYERDGQVVYNTSVLLGRDGQLVGKYRKVCLPREEIDGGVTPGREYPVFDADFGRVAMMICWDVHFPEVARRMSAQGAEMILMPIWGGNETLARARAIENQVYLAASGYDFKTAIFDKDGRTLAESSQDSQVIMAEVDLNDRRLWPWLGDWRSRIWREAPP